MRSRTPLHSFTPSLLAAVLSWGEKHHYNGAFGKSIYSMAVHVSDRVGQFLAFRACGRRRGRDGRQVYVGQQGVAVAERRDRMQLGCRL